MNNIKRCIFHIPATIETEGRSGSTMRPWKMLKAFEANGYSVEIVMGEGNERKKQIGQIKKAIKNGIKYDFLYSESRNIPTLLSEKDHIPRYPFLDFGFMKYCKRHGINIGLFYRDIYWKFPIYKEKVSFIKRSIEIPLFYYDLVQYNRWVNKLYLPSMLMKEYVNVVKNIKIDMLPPGCDEREIDVYHSWQKEKGVLNLFYVGGIGKMYDITKLLKVVKEQRFVRLTICCREQEWKSCKRLYKNHLCDRVEVVHKFGEELVEFYERADICMLFFENERYRDFAMPVKLFEYISYLKPIIATKGTAAGSLVKEENIGWQIDFDEDELKKLLNYLFYNHNEIENKKANLKKAVENNSWKARARKVIEDLTNENGVKR